MQSLQDYAYNFMKGIRPFRANRVGVFSTGVQVTIQVASVCVYVSLAGGQAMPFNQPPAGYGDPFSNNALSAARKGLDYSWGRQRPAVVKAAGYTFVCRYLSWHTTGKKLTPGEAEALIGAGIDDVCNWEFDPQ